jgi:hypothetical protein
LSSIGVSHYNSSNQLTSVLLGGYVFIGGAQVLTTRQSGPANTTDTTDCATKLNQLLACLRTHGLIA